MKHPGDPTEKITHALEGALALLRDAAFTLPPADEDQPAEASLLQQCLAMCEHQESRQPEAIRTVHHFACTGGTLISKCISAMPNVQLLSEVDPLSTGQFNPARPRFAPTDMVTLMRQSTRGVNEQLLVELFHGQMRVVHSEASRLGQRLVLRDHAHSHFCNGPAVPGRLNFRALLPDGFPVLSVLTVRHPLDSFASLVDRKWLQFEPGTIDEYSHRYLEFLRQYEGVPQVRYEDFVADPVVIMRGICSLLELPFSPDFGDLFDVFHLTGDSGRRSAVISARPSRPVAAQLQDEALESGAYMQLVGRLGYPARLAGAGAA